jgi:hypothetical protein
MNPLGNGQRVRYRIIVSGIIAASIKHEQMRARVDGKGEAFLSALEYVTARMIHDPHNLGEPIFPLRAIQVLVHLVFVPPLALEFAIHHDQPMIFLRRVSYIPKD